VPVDVGDSFSLDVGKVHEACWNHEPDDAVCRRAPLRGIPDFSGDSITECVAGSTEEPFSLSCKGERAERCTPSMDFRLSPILERDKKVVERGYLVVRWNLRDGNYDDDGVFSPCLEACEEGFRVRIEMLDR
jgi:hypothetical protein